MDKPELGRIIWGEFIDTRGNRAGPHRAVIITSNQDIVAGKPIRVAVISSNLQMEAPENMVLLPYLKSRDGHIHTKLKIKCAAVCTWRPVIAEKDITGYGGSVKGKYLLEILKRIGELDAGYPNDEEA